MFWVEEVTLTHLLTVAWCDLLSLGTMNEGGCFSIKAMQSLWMFVDEGVILRHELPSDFGRNDRGIGVGHDAGVDVVHER